ncbi:MAG: DUF1634 domain-containing protein [Desulfomicrobium sp.]|nr:DUF1634 domain-containing protein [Desulfomicrobium sp.]NLV97443.1 DUF1634 domain-containing protein [Desulfovibrionales bacterium]
MNTEKTNAPAEQITYANILFYGCWGGLALIIVIYLIYITGILDPYVSMAKVTHYWALPVQNYLTDNNVPTGWGWLTLLNKGDFLNFLGIALLAGLTIICYLPIIFAYLKKNDRAYTIIALLEVIVLCVAASGIVGTGGH